MKLESRIDLNLFSFMNWTSPEILASPIEYLKGVGPLRGIFYAKNLVLTSSVICLNYILTGI